MTERVVAGLRIRIDGDLCVGFGDCVGLAPEAFVLEGDGPVAFLAPEQADPERLLDACRTCPVDALSVVDAEGRQLVP